MAEKPAPKKDNKTGKQRIDKDGKPVWILTVANGRDAAGKRARARREFHGSDKEAQKAYDRFKVEVAEAGIGSNMTLAAWVAVWDREHIARNVAPKTAVNYRILLKNRIIPNLGSVRLNALAPRKIKDFYASLNEEGARMDRRGKTLSGATQAKVHRILSALLQEAVYREIIPRNPVADVRPPRERRPELRYLEESDILIMMQELSKESLRFRLIVLLALTTGMRRGEIMGLEWKHIDWTAHSITIAQSAFITSGNGQRLKAPKTAQSIRLVSMPADVEDTLRAWQRQQTDEREKAGSLYRVSDFIFTTWEGHWVSVDQITKEWRRFLSRVNKRAKDEAEKQGRKAAELPIIPFHGLRHTAASLFIAGGLDVRSVSGVLGHAQASTTLNIYSHMLQSAPQNAATMMQTMLDRTSGNMPTKTPTKTPI